MTQQARQNYLYYAPQCPNCTRFISALDSTPARQSVTKVDVYSLPLQHRNQITAVPTLVLSNGAALVGAQVFSWLKEFEQDLEPASYCGGRGLPFSSIDDNQGLMTFSTSYSDFMQAP